MTSELTEFARDELAASINGEAKDRAALEADYGTVWDTAALHENYDVIDVMTPYVIVCRKADAAVGVLLFQREPRYYFHFRALPGISESWPGANKSYALLDQGGPAA
jgi:hypothetical protein